ncbi:MAG: hypothetical protein U9O83_02185 [Campylobacterota bacterium]|nr:hypothetical protein [Campylobacterota bacterium]
MKTKILSIAAAILLLSSSIFAADHFIGETEKDTVIKENQKKKLLFQKNKKFICKESGQIYSNAQIISKDDNWSIYDEYFKKDKLLLNIALCNLVNKEIILEVIK